MCESLAKSSNHVRVCVYVRVRACMYVYVCVCVGTVRACVRAHVRHHSITKQLYDNDGKFVHGNLS